MNTPLDLAPRPPSHPQPAPEGQELSLEELLALFASEDAGTKSMRRSLRSSGALLLGWAQGSSRRAARWGAVASTPDLRSSRSTAGVME